ncbi:MAG: tRNA (adenosine(37)-N6)-threonylcarbamoyltransferase complex transferase subunit TsaD [Phycisphaerae bacterium]|nr:tRNA (adenosine(37)-N6)-threonylcarbamoyltransferase complex transferase subunit TsaD [Phycisphaerae bacterium]
MNKEHVVILGIESSCDETSAAVVMDGRNVLSCAVASQNELHEKFKGVVPEIASRAHLEKINLIIESAMAEAKIGFDRIDAVAAVNQPGLVGSLLIGFTAGKTLAWALGKPLLAVHHVHAHAYGAVLNYEMEARSAFPAVAFLVSGGHTSLFKCHDPLEMELIGSTQDDAAGEAFDKVACILGLGYPGGPLIDKLAKEGDTKAVHFPRTWLKKAPLDFSFSGLKTAVLYHVRGRDLSRPDSSHLSRQEKADIAASFQAAVIEVLVEKAILACRETGYNRLLVGGGVAANSYFRRQIAERSDREGIELIMALPKHCTDNAAMVAGLGYHQYMAERFSALDASVYSTL